MADASLVQHEVLRAEAAAEGFALVARGWGFEEDEAQAEAARERAAIMAEASAVAVGCSGLVSVPTTPTRAAAAHAAHVATEAAKRLRSVDSLPLHPSHGRLVRKRLSQARPARVGAGARSVLAATVADAVVARIARMRRSVGFAARCHVAGAPRKGYRPDVCKFLTLTYARAADWNPQHLTRFIDRLRVWLKRRGIPCRYVWVAEVQEGRAERTGESVIHYHAVVWVPEGTYLPRPDDCGWWPHGSTRTEQARDAVAYVMKYVSKGGEFGHLPQGARMHGVGGLEHAQRRAKRWLGYPAWIKSRADINDDWRPAQGGGWLHPDGLVIPSTHVRAWIGDRWAPLQVIDYGVGKLGQVAAGPFSWLPEVR